MPKLSPTMEEGQISRWLKNEGDTVSTGEGIAEIDTDKATMEAQALTTGVLRKIIIQAGETVPLGNVIAIIGEADEDISQLLAQAGASDGNQPQANEEPQPEAKDAADSDASPDAATQTKASTAQTPTAPIEEKSKPQVAPSEAASANGEKSNGRLIVSPLAARMAAEAGLNLNSLQGSGPGGRIVKRDVEEAMKSSASQVSSGAQDVQTKVASQPVTPEQPTTQSVVQSESNAPYREEKNSEMRRTIARRLTSSLAPVPHFFLTTEIEMDSAVNLRKQLNELDAESETKISINDMIIKVAATALMNHPNVNASYQDQTTRFYNQADIGVAVALDDGLITPIIRAANTKSIGHISREIREMAERARNKKLKPEEYTGATFSVSNLGMLGIDEFTAIINPPEAAILAVGAVAAKPVVRNGEIEVANIMRVTLSCDHRIIDGATGAKFLQTFKQIMENPMRLLV